MAALGDQRKLQLGTVQGVWLPWQQGSTKTSERKVLGLCRAPTESDSGPGTFLVSLSPAIGQVSILGRKTRLKWGRGDPSLQLSKSMALSTPVLLSICKWPSSGQAWEGACPCPAEVRLTPLHDHAIQLTWYFLSQIMCTLSSWNFPSMVPGG